MRRWVSAIAMVALLAPVAAYPQAKSGSKSAVYEQLNLFDEAFERIRQDAVEPVGDDKLISTAIAGMLSALDPHAVYLTEAEYKAQQAPTPEQSGSLGMVVTIENGQLQIVSPRDGSPAAEAGVKPGDAIFMIDKEPTYDLTLGDVEQRLRGPVGSEVTLLLRRGTGSPIEVKIKRAAPGDLTTLTSHIEGGNIGYIRLAGFDDKTAASLGAAIGDMRKQANDRLIGFVLDLRNNPGGNFDAAVATADALIDKGDIAIIKGRKADATKHLAATPGDAANGVPIVAIVNGGTGREAELVAGALHDNHRAVLLGTKTFGESAIETTLPLNGNGAIRLTTSRYVTPAGNAIQGKGIEPDLSVSPLKLERFARAEQRHEADLRGALKNTDPVAPSAAGAKAPPADKDKGPPPGATPSESSSKTLSEPAVATRDIGGADDEQLIEALDVLRGLAMTSARNTR